MDYGLRTVHCGLRTVDYGLWTTDCVSRGSSMVGSKEKVGMSKVTYSAGTLRNGLIVTPCCRTRLTIFPSGDVIAVHSTCSGSIQICS